MSIRPIMDAGPGLNFLSTNKERLLIGALGALSVPETVEDEILRKSRSEPRFNATEKVWRKLSPKYIQVLSDDVTEELAAVVHRLTGVRFNERVQVRQDLGETMVIAHAVVTAERGQDVVILIDERDGRKRAAREAQRLDRLRQTESSVGRITLVSTQVVLEIAVGRALISGRQEMRKIYDRLRELDDGLPHVSETNLLSPQLWNKH